MNKEFSLYPTKCNLCGGKVEYTTNDKIYGKKYGSGYCYLCTNCGAYVGTHKPRPKEAFGILANSSMRTKKMKCHDIFDSIWKSNKHPVVKRRKMYAWLAKELKIPISECHFGYFDEKTLDKAYEILVKVKNK